jgi:tRNA dimethylallyltransferase
MANKQALVLFIGPTAVGKTRLAISSARKMGDVEIISCDSRLFYRGMDIGTAKPTVEEMEGIPHHLIDIADPDEVLSLGLFQQRARECIQDIAGKGHLPFLVGGTGQYVRAVTEGWTVPSVEPDERLRNYLNRVLEQQGLEELARWLRMLDGAAYASVDLRNPRRVLRALEIILATGEPLAKRRTRSESPYRLIQIGISMPREQLFKRIDDRVDLMISTGLEAEVRALIDRGYGPDLPSMSAIGYQEMAAFIRGEMTIEDAVVLMKRRTHAFVRRQANWFKESDPDICWFKASELRVEDLVRYIRERLAEDSTDHQE